MKKRIFGALIISTILFAPTANAQGGLKGLKEKVLGGSEKSTTSEEKSAGSEDGKKTKMSEEEKDKVDAFLDSKEYKKDDKGINGIYYSSAPIYSNSQSGTSTKTLSKFILEYNVNMEEKYHDVKLFSKYAYETTNRNNFVEPLRFTSSATFSIDVKAAEKSGVVYMNRAEFSQTKLKKVVWTVDLQDNWIAKGTEFRALREGLIMVEPGIFILGSVLQDNQQIKKDLYREKQPLIVLYKKEKEEEAMKYTGKLGYEKIDELVKKHSVAFDEIEKGKAELPKPTSTFKEEPTNASLVEAVKKRMTEMPYYKNKQLVYVYNVSPWEQKFENIGLLGRTLTYRQMQVVAVFKDGSKCQYARMLIRQDNSYVGGTSQEKWTGNPVFCNGDQHLEDIGCDKANLYKK